MEKRSLKTICVVGLVLFGLVTAAGAAVNLEWRPSASTVTVGDPLTMGLYAVASGDQSEFISALDAVFLWDPAYLGEISLPNEPLDMWMLDGFSDFASDDINLDISDGNAQYTAWGNFGEPIEVTSAGLLCAEFQFETLAPVNMTPVTIAESYGVFCETVVLDGTVGNLDITGSLGCASVKIVSVPEPASLCALLTGLGLVITRKLKRA